MLYDLFFIIFSVFYLPYFLLSGKWRSFSRQRLGIFDNETLSRIKGSGAVWLHAVSVGEVMASVPLYEELRRILPGGKIIVSTVTATGNKIARERFKDAAAIIYLPLDMSCITDSVVKLIRPGLVLIAETEIWPNLITSLKKNGAKIVIFNGRVSPNSFRNYGMVRPLLKGVLQKIDLYLMQFQADADRIISLGAPVENVKATGNLKYDAALMRRAGDAPDVLRKNLGLEGGEKLLIAGSTNPGEEEKILHCYKELAEEFPELRLLIAPRHTDRTGSVAGLVRGAGFTPRLISSPGAGAPGNGEVLILDVMGRLAHLYAAADIVFIGGSLINKGGQNPLEAACHSKVVLFGPYTHNFEEITNDLISARGAVKVGDEAELVASLRVLLENDAERRKMGENARRTLESKAGAAKKDFDLIKPFLGRI
ncbi:MAG: 3-deoxy-D-manno-octulosonic acid transferase [Candidatus Omnitrophica bacterium]|nr:3-deoxy-D-manno-octulosonic acid transferase [Candidatus Omnitrophota bacterium]MDD5310831.1 3-deoxy-D-manno-octulosonic acid transferase [Candidatus Omnitrophota bacterium]